MKIYKLIAFVVVLMGLSETAQTQRALPVQVKCVKGQGVAPDGGSWQTFAPICGDVKKAINRSTQFKQKGSGNRYVIWIYAIKGLIDGGSISMSVSTTATISDPLSKMFPYHIAALPMVFEPSESAIYGEAFVEAALPLFVDFFSDYVDEINSSGYLARELSEELQNEIAERSSLEMERYLKEKAKNR